MTSSLIKLQIKNKIKKFTNFLEYGNISIKGNIFEEVKSWLNVIQVAEFKLMLFPLANRLFASRFAIVVKIKILSGIKLPLQFEYDKLYFFRENFETNENEISMLHVIIIFSLVSGTSILTVDQQP